MRGVASLAFAALVLTPAAAQKPDFCARFEEPLAYNACLAEHGPRAAATGRRSASPDEEAPSPVRRAPHGRQRLEFNVRD